MKKSFLAIILALGLVGVLCGSAAAGVMGYNMDKAGRDFDLKPTGEVSAAVMAVDALVVRPAGLGLTIAGTAAFVATLPFSIPSQSVGRAADGLIVKPGGYTFVRPMGKGDTRFEERHIFGW